VDKAPDAFRTISEVAEELHVPQHVLRFWESRFREIKPLKRGGGRRYYRPEDIGLLRGIHHLLYGEGYTIRGVQRILRDQGVKFVQTVWQPGAPRPTQPVDTDDGADVAEADIAEADVGEDEEFDAEEATSSERSEPGPRLAPSIIDREDAVAAGRGPQIPRAVAPAVISATSELAPRPSRRGLSPDSVGKLTSVLRDLSECRKLLEAAAALR
jgi:DNA-binding transcriptional MerR regulator